MTLSPPIRVFAVVAALVGTALAASLLLLGRSAEESQPVASTTRPAVQTKPSEVAPVTSPEPAAKPRTPRTPSANGLPAPIARALRANRVAVVAVYMPGASVDAIVRKEARAGAAKARVGYVAISATSAKLVGPLVAKTGVLPDPAVVIVKRPGVVVATLGVTDRDLVAQAALQAKR